MSIVRLIKKGVSGEPVTGKKFIEKLRDNSPAEYDRKLSWVGDNPAADPDEVIKVIGTGGIASESVPAALWSFLSAREDPEEALIRAVNLGGDTDTIGPEVNHEGIGQVHDRMHSASEKEIGAPITRH